MRFVLISLAAVILLIGEVHAQAKLSEDQVKQLHQAVCSEPVRATKEGRLDGWVCDYPRDYPIRDASAFCPVNTLNFSSRSGGLFDVFFGRFTTNQPQAIAMYSAFCESHANLFGGMALFNVMGQKFELVRYYPGLRAVDCVVPPVQSDERQTAYCFLSSVAQGSLGEVFGPIRFKNNGEAAFDTWFRAGNDDGHLAPMTGCKTNKPEPHHISALRFDEAKSDVVLDVAVLDPRSVASACTRLRRRDFDETEKELRKSSIVARGMAFIREDELKFVRMVVRFRAPSARARIKLTSEPAGP